MFFHKKVTVTTEPEKKPLTENELKTQFAIFNGQAKVYESKLRTNLNKHLQAAAGNRLKGLPAKNHINFAAYYQAQIEACEQKRLMLEFLVEKIDIIKMNQEFLKAFGGVVEVLSGADVNIEGIDQLSAQITRATAEIQGQEEKLSEAMDALGMSIESTAGIAQHNAAEEKIAELIDQTISDAKLGGEVTPEAVAKKVSDSISFEA